MVRTVAFSVIRLGVFVVCKSRFKFRNWYHRNSFRERPDIAKITSSTEWRGGWGFHKVVVNVS